MKLEDALNIEFDSDIGNVSIRGYFQALLETLYRETEGFSGKRPFGNSGWDWDIYPPLIKAGLISGKLDEDGDIEEVNEGEAHRYVMNLIKAMCQGVGDD